MIGKTIRHGSVPAVLAAACFWMTVPSHAQNRGVYPLGMTALNSGVMPESTFTYSNQLLLYTRDQAKDNEGQTLRVTGNHSVILDMNTTVCHEMLSETTPLTVVGLWSTNPALDHAVRVLLAVRFRRQQSHGVRFNESSKPR